MNRSAAEIFHEARELPAARRGDFLAGACGKDLALRAKVEALLKADAEAGGFMASPTAGSAARADAVPSQEEAGAQIGRYKLLEQIGEGGMGTIWMAEQREPVKRRVALKIIKLGMDTKQVIARFEAERQALAMMDHPHIAKVLDAGATDTGRPYFVMEYIKGIPILEYCDKERLDTTARLGLFTNVCHAIQHAHQKGIIHRDIKPSNVLVTLHDGTPVPKVIDFGIAKATNSELTTKTLFTEHRQMIGTPAYMSPEQAEMSGLDIDTRSDIYALGVLLYELLTGTTPFDTKALLESGYAEMMRAIREDEPHKPSTRISSLGDTGTRTASQRRIDLKKLSTLLRGDLDWIVMKCLEKDRSRRYDTANGLAADIKRHLSDEPVSAGAPSASYKLRKFAKRNRAKVIAAGIVAAVLVLGVIGTTGGMVWANSERARAESEKSRATLAGLNEATAKTEAQANERRAIAEGARANAAKDDEAEARQRAETIGAFVIEALRSSDADQGGREDTTILQAMDRAIADLDAGRFADDAATEAALQVTIGTILRNNGRLREAEGLLTQALETEQRLDSPNVGVATNELAIVKNKLGHTAEAKALFVAALELDRRHFPGDHSAVARGLSNLATVLPPAEAEPLLRQALAMDRRLQAGDSDAVAADLVILAGKFVELGRTAEAEPLLEEALAMGRRLHKGDHPSLPKLLDNLAQARRSLGRTAEAVELLTEALAMQRRLFKAPHPDLATAMNNLASTLVERERFAEAESLYAELLEMRQRMFAGDHLEIAVGLTKLGYVRAAQDRAAQAEPLLVQALEMHRRLASRDDLAAASNLDDLGTALQLVGRLDDAEAVLVQALAMRERIHDGDQLDLAGGLNNLATVQAARGRLSEAEVTQRRSVEMYRRLISGDHTDLAGALDGLAILQRDQGRPTEAERLELEAVEMYQRLSVGDHPRLALALFNLGTMRAAAGRVADAVQPYEAAMQMYQRLLPAGHRHRIGSMTRLAETYYATGSFEKAIPLFENALQVQAVTPGRQHADTLMTIANLGANYRSAGRVAEAVPLLEEAWRNVDQHPRLRFVGWHLLDAYVHVADPAKEIDTTRAMNLLDELLAHSRATLAKESAELAGDLSNAATQLSALKAWDAAEPLLREARAIREKVQPDAWTTFNTQSLLGGALLGQKRYAEAEPLLLAGYRGMKERESQIGAKAGARIPQALERIVQFYDATGNVNEAASWRRELETLRAKSSPGIAR